MEQSFSQRMGLKPSKTFQINSMDDDFRKSLWNVLTQFVWHIVSDKTKRELQITIWMHFFHRLLDEVPHQTEKLQEFLKESFFTFEWYEVYDFIEFIANHYPMPGYLDEFINVCNETLKKHLSPYQFIGATLVPITSDREIAEIKQALDITKQYMPHLDKALKFLADRSTPDYANSIKESISAVEAICRLITDDPRVTLGKALERLKSKRIVLHDNLKEAFKNIYWYTSDAQGIRHGLVGKADLDVEDARFMLIACSAFINYLMAKAEKAGIELSPS